MGAGIAGGRLTGLAAALALAAAPVAARADAAADAAEAAGEKAVEADNPQQALADFRRAAARDPSMGEAWMGIGRALFDLKKYPDALPPLRRAVQLMPDSDVAHFWLGYALEADGQDGAAVPELMQAIRLKSDESSYYTVLATAQMAMGAPMEAGRSLQQALRVDPKDAEALWSLGMTLVQLDMLPEAQKVVTSLQPLDAKGAAELGDGIKAALQSRAKASGADKSTGQVGPAPAASADAIAQGWVFYKQSRYRDAAFEFQAAIRADPKVSAAHCGLGEAALADDFVHDAVVALEQAVNLDSNNGEAWSSLGMAYALQGRTIEATRILVRLKSADPKHAAALEQILSSGK